MFDYVSAYICIRMWVYNKSTYIKGSNTSELKRKIWLSQTMLGWTKTVQSWNYTPIPSTMQNDLEAKIDNRPIRPDRWNSAQSWRKKVY